MNSVKQTFKYVLYGLGIYAALVVVGLIIGFWASSENAFKGLRF